MKVQLSQKDRRNEMSRIQVSSLEKTNLMLESKVDLIRQKFEGKVIFQETYNDTRERPSLIKTPKSLKNLIEKIKDNIIIDPYSEGDDSETDEKLKEASIKDVLSNMVDFSNFLTLKKIEDFPKEASAGLIFMNLDDWMTINFMRQFIDDTPCFKNEFKPEIESIQILKYKKILNFFVKFKKLSDAEKIFNFFNHPHKKKNLPTKNSHGEPIEVLYCYEQSELTLSRYYAVILRNLPLNCSQEEVKNFCESRVTGVLYALLPMKIKNSVCSIVVLRDLDDAENLCQSLKKDHSSKNKKMKVHVDPRSSKIRRNNEKSHFSKILAKRGEVRFNEIMIQSGEMISKSVSFVKIFSKLFEKKGRDASNLNKKEEKKSEGMKDEVKSPKTELKINEASKSQVEAKTIIASTSHKDGRNLNSQFGSSNLLVLLQNKNEHKTEGDSSKEISVCQKNEQEGKKLEKLEKLEKQISKAGHDQHDHVENENGNDTTIKEPKEIKESKESKESKEPSSKFVNDQVKLLYVNSSELVVENIISQAQDKEIPNNQSSTKTSNPDKTSNLQPSSTLAPSKKIGAGISNLGKVLGLFTAKTPKVVNQSQQKPESNHSNHSNHSNLNSSIVNTSLEQSVDIDSTVNTTTNQINNENYNFTPICNLNSPVDDISNIESNSILQVEELTETEIQFYTYDFKDKNYYESVRQAKSSEPEEKSRKREKSNFSNFSNFSNAPPVQETKIESIVDSSVSNSIISSVTQNPTIPFANQIPQNLNLSNYNCQAGFISSNTLVENFQTYANNPQLNSNITGSKQGQAYGYQTTQNRKFNNHYQGQGNYHRNYNNKFQNNQNLNNYQNKATSASVSASVSELNSNMHFSAQNTQNTQNTKNTQNTQNTQNIQYSRNNHNYNTQTWPKKNYNSHSHSSYNKNQPKNSFPQPTIINNVNINMIQSSSSLPNPQPANIINNIILPQSSIPPNITYQSLEEISKEIVKPPEDHMLPPLPPDEPRADEKVEPGQVLSDEEKLPVKRKRNFSPGYRSRSGSYSRHIKKKRHRSRSPYKKDHYDHRGRDVNYRNKEKYHYNSSIHLKKSSRSRSRSDSRSKEDAYKPYRQPEYNINNTSPSNFEHNSSYRREKAYNYK